jgi:hypothetical protein
MNITINCGVDGITGYRRKMQGTFAICSRVKNKLFLRFFLLATQLQTVKLSGFPVSFTVKTGCQ